MQSSVQYKQIALVLDPENDAYREDLMNSLAFLADAWMDSCDLGKSIDFRQQTVDLARDLFTSAPGNPELKLELAYTLSGLASVQRRIPIPDQALANLRESRDLLEQLALQDDGNPSLLWGALTRKAWMLQIRAWNEPLADVWPEFRSTKENMENMREEMGSMNFNATIDFASFLLHFSLLAQELGYQAEADSALATLMDQLTALVEEKPENRSSMQILARAWWEYWARNGVLPNEHAVSMLEHYLVDPERATSCNDAGLAARLEIMRGNTFLASDYTLYLLEKGYFEPGFVAFCRDYKLCD